MDDGTITKIDASQKMRNLIQNKFGKLFNAYYIGIPDAIPEAAMPCIIIQKTGGSISVGATMTDERTEDIELHVALNGKIGWGTPSDDDTVMRQLQNLIEGIDPATGYYLDSSLMGLLRTNLTMDSTIINSDMIVNYDITPRTDQPSICEAIITITIDERVLVPNRI